MYKIQKYKKADIGRSVQIQLLSPAIQFITPEKAPPTTSGYVHTDFIYMLFSTQVIAYHTSFFFQLTLYLGNCLSWYIKSCLLSC